MCCFKCYRKKSMGLKLVMKLVKSEVENVKKFQYTKIRGSFIKIAFYGIVAAE